jgi:hypothetical protein
LATGKARFLNAFVKGNDVQAVIELGCGDGNQLPLAAYPQYIGLDVSKTAIELCKIRFAGDPGKSFFLYGNSCSSTAPACSRRIWLSRSMSSIISLKVSFLTSTWHVYLMRPSVM